MLVHAQFSPWWDPEWSRTEFVSRVLPDRLTEQEKRQRHIIFKVGPPASGKSEALSYALRELGISQDPYLEINIDKMVERVQEYRDQMTRVKTSLIKSLTVSKEMPCLAYKPIKECQTLISPDVHELVCNLDFMTYFKHRPAADAEAQAILFHEFITKPHYRNVVYESTGSNGSYDYIQRVGTLARMYGFKIHIVYPFVKRTELIRRSELRALKLGRLVCTHRIKQLRRESRLNLREIISKLDIPDFPIDSVLILNNDGPKGNMTKICHFFKNAARNKYRKKYILE